MIVNLIKELKKALSSYFISVAFWLIDKADRLDNVLDKDIFTTRYIISRIKIPDVKTEIKTPYSSIISRFDNQENLWIAEIPETGLIGYGDTEELAKEDLFDCIEKFMEEFRSK